MVEKIENFINELSKIINPTEYELFFKNSKFDFSQAEENHIVIITSPHGFIKENLKNKFLDIIKELYIKMYNKIVWIEFKIDKSLSKDTELTLQSEPAEVIRPSNSDGNIVIFNENNFNEKYTFENFVVGDSNQFARASAWAVATNPGKHFNPLFIYGGPGLGKTHLMQAIGHYVRKHYPKLKVVYITSEEFTNKFINALTQKKTHLFREKFQQIDILLIDDIQFLVGKEQTQETFFHTFNSLHSSGRQLIISSDKPPKELSSFEERLRSRMEWGLQADIQQPRYETRLAILKQLNEYNGSNIESDALEFIATNFKTDVRELEGAFNKVFAFTKAYPDADINIYKSIFKDIIENGEMHKNIPIPKIIKAAGKYLNIDTEQIMSNKRDQPIAFGRQLAMYLSKEICDYPYKFIGKAFNKDHSTVIHSCKKIQEMIDTDHGLLETVNKIKKNILNERE